MKHGMCLLLAEIVVNGRHKETLDYTISTDTKRAYFQTNDRFDQWNQIWGVFYKTTTHISQAASKDKARSARYSFKPQFSVKANALIDSVVNDEVTIDYTAIVNAPTWTPEEYQLKTYVTPDVNAIKHAIRQAGYSIDERLYFWAYAKITEHYDGKVPQFYRNSDKTERLSGFGPLNLQNKPKVVRDVILTGYNKYDLNASAFAMLLSQVDASKYPLLEQYTRNTKAMRMQILADSNLQETGVTLEHVKTAITAMGFGSNLANQHCKLRNEMSNTIVDALSQHKVLAGFKAELTALRAELNLTIKQAVALYQLHENEVMQLIRQQTQTPDNALLVYDEIYTLDTLDVASMQLTIKNTLNITVGIK